MTYVLFFQKPQNTDFVEIKHHIPISCSSLARALNLLIGTIPPNGLAIWIFLPIFELELSKVPKLANIPCRFITRSSLSLDTRIPVTTLHSISLSGAWQMAM
jgi:hypothetical protein